MAALPSEIRSSAIWAAMVSLFVSFTCIAGMLLLMWQPLPGLQVLKSVPLLHWCCAEGFPHGALSARADWPCRWAHHIVNRR